MIEHIAEALAKVREMAEMVNTFLHFKVCFLSRPNAKLVIYILKFRIQVFARSVQPFIH